MPNPVFVYVAFADSLPHIVRLFQNRDKFIKIILSARPAPSVPVPAQMCGEIKYLVWRFLRRFLMTITKAVFASAALAIFTKDRRATLLVFHGVASLPFVCRLGISLRSLIRHVCLAES